MYKLSIIIYFHFYYFIKYSLLLLAFISVRLEGKTGIT